MSLLVTNISYQQAIRSIREVVLDTSPVQCFNVSGQGFSFKKDGNGFVIDTDTYTFEQVEKYYDLIRKLRAKEVTIEILPDYVTTEKSDLTSDFDYADITTSKLVARENYFSDYTIEKVMEEFFANYLSYDAIPKTTERMFNDLDYMWRKKLILWVAYYLVDRKRMNYASVSEMIRLQSNSTSTEGCVNDSQFKNTEKTITTRVGEVFTVTERETDSGKGLDGFTDFWGDKYGYFTKLQLYIRDRFEKQFKDFSLRDDCMISQSFTMEKNWQEFAWVDTHNMSEYTRDVLNPSRD